MNIKSTKATFYTFTLTVGFILLTLTTAKLLDPAYMYFLFISGVSTLIQLREKDFHLTLSYLERNFNLCSYTLLSSVGIAFYHSPNHTRLSLIPWFLVPTIISYSTARNKKAKTLNTAVSLLLITITIWSQQGHTNSN